MDSIVLQNFLSGKHETKIRHTITPNINFSYRPNTHPWQTYQSDSLGNTQSYSPFSNNIYGTVNSSESGRIGFSLINSLELKRKNLKDTTNKEPFLKSKILENLSLNSGYDLTKDSFQLDNIRIIGRTTLWKKVNLRFAGQIDPYQYENGQRINQYQFSKNKSIGNSEICKFCFRNQFEISKKQQKGI